MAESPVLDTPVKIKFTKLFIGGEFVDSISGKTFPTYDPRTGDVIAHLAEADDADVDRAVKAARQAFDEGSWPRMTGYERGRVLYKLADLLEQHSDELAAIETLDQGKPYKVAQEVNVLTISYLRSHAGWADKIVGHTFKPNGPFHAYTLHEPIGVVGLIIPWNFPTYMFVTKISCALACGNTVVVKPAEQTPLTALFCAKLTIEAGIPPGVVNVVPGYGPTAGASIGKHMDIDKLVFTGSTEVGRLLMEASARSNLKPVTLELGGKAPLIIFDDADLEMAVEIAHAGGFFNMGQVCVTEARVMTGGTRYGSKGLFIQPTIFSDVKDSMKIAQDEIFGPVMAIMKFKTGETC